MNLNKMPNENENQYIWRLCSAKDSGLLDLSWSELANIFNKELLDNDIEYNESTYRKKYQQAKTFYEDVFSKMISNEYNEELMAQKRELQRAKIAFRDERNAWQKQNYIDARVESKLDLLEEKLSEIGKVNFVPIKNNNYVIYSDNDIVCCLSDLHIGQTFSSNFGEYNTDIARQRLFKYLNEIISIGKRHRSQNIYVELLGDEISGNIHKSIQVTNRENVIEQIKIASEYISNFCYELSKYFSNVYVVSVAGNHSRLVDNKNDAMHDERLDTLITWIVEQTTKHIDNITVLNDSNLDSGISVIKIRGNTFVGVHGDLDSHNKSKVSDLVMMLGFFPTAILNGHRHFPAFTEVNGVKLIQCGSLSGSGDDYTVEKRLSGKPSQTVLICNDKGIECIYNVELDEVI